MREPLTRAHETDLVSRDAGGRWGEPRRVLPGGGIAPFSPDGRWVATFTGDASTPTTALELAPVAGGEPRVLLTVRDLTADVAPIWPALCLWSADGRVVYFVGRDPKSGEVGVWGVPVAGGAARRVVRFDDPARPWHRNGIALRGEKFYFTLGDRQSDVWMGEIARTP